MKDLCPNPKCENRQICLRLFGQGRINCKPYKEDEDECVTTVSVRSDNGETARGASLVLQLPLQTAATKGGGS